jgi:hypothetical protein
MTDTSTMTRDDIDAEINEIAGIAFRLRGDELRAARERCGALCVATGYMTEADATEALAL